MRAAAAKIVAQVVEARRPVDELLSLEHGVAARDRALLAALVLGALRWHFRLEWQAQQLLARPVAADQPELAALLRVGLLQLQELRVPPHAAVSATVDAASLIGARAAGGLLNAVLRRYQRERDRLLALQASSEEALFAHPRWIIEALRSDYPDDWKAILAANNALPPMWLRVNLRKTTRAAYLAALEAAGLAAVPDAEVSCAVRLADPVDVDRLPGFTAGEVSVQDVAAQRAAALLDLHPGQRVLDACAAPGGKTGHILEALGERGEVWAVDRDARRMQRVAANLRRLGSSAKLLTGDATQPAQWWDGTPFDRVLLDAPCSALGVIRRHPDIKVRRTPADVARAVALQADMLRALWPLVAPGGLLLFATCTVLKRENDEQIDAFRRNEANFEPIGANSVESVQWLPEEARGDGFYYACLRKSPSPQPNQWTFPAKSSSSAKP